MNFGNVSRDDIQQLINDLYHKEHLSYSSIKKVYNALNACYRHAQIGDVISLNPCLGVILPSAAERTKQIQPLSPSEIEILRRELRKEDGSGKPLYHYANAFLLILNTGLRMGEALALQWSDVNFSTRTLTVSKNSKGKPSDVYSIDRGRSASSKTKCPDVSIRASIILQ